MANSIFINIFLFGAFIALSFAQAPECSVDADVGFLLDSSGSITNFYQIEKDFLNTVAAAFGIGNGKSRGSVVTFSYYSKLSIKFKDFDTLGDFQKAVNRIPLMRMTTYMDRALRLAQKEMFALKNGARSGKAKLLIMLTDGKQTKKEKYEDPAAVVADLRKDGIQVIVVGMGKNINAGEVQRLAGGKEYAFKADQFRELATQAFLGKVKSKACDAAEESLTMQPTKKPAATPSTDICPDIDIDYQGNDVKLDLNVPSWKECAKACKANGACKYFTFVADSGCCYHKSAKGKITKAAGLTSGSQDCTA